MHRIIIDGYNLLFYAKENSCNLEEGRTMVELITEMLKGFQAIPYKIKKRLVFVFDGNKSAYGNPREQLIGGFKVIFSSPGKTADQKIIDIVRKSKNPTMISSRRYAISRRKRKKYHHSKKDWIRFQRQNPTNSG